MRGQGEIDKVEAAAGQFPLFAVVVLSQVEGRSRPGPLFDGCVAPQVGSPVSVGDVQEGDALQGRAVGQIQRHSIAL